MTTPLATAPITHKGEFGLTPRMLEHLLEHLLVLLLELLLVLLLELLLELV